VLPDDVTVHVIRHTGADALLNRIGTPPWIVDHVNRRTRMSKSSGACAWISAIASRSCS
jgi:hypothetical protein